MTTPILTSAPGKIVLSGEYAVLDGACGVAMAVDRRARVKLRASTKAYSEISSPSFCEEMGQCDIRVTPPAWLRGSDDYAIVDAVLRQMSAPLLSNYSMQLDTRAFIESATGEKLGVGSSAALCVALVLGLNGGADIAQVSHDTHRQFQQGLGSGIDIACSVRGGLMSYRMQGAEVTSLTWPDELHYRVLWSGTAANTRHKIAKLNSAAIDGDFASRQELIRAADRMAACWQSSRALDILGGYEEYLAALLAFDEDYALGIFAAGHDDLLRAARRAGLMYKPCGAGGGDVGILLGIDNERLDTFVRQHCGAFKVIECALDIRGASVENTSEENMSVENNGEQNSG